jgi:hypothetical protein
MKRMIEEIKIVQEKEKKEKLNEDLNVLKQLILNKLQNVNLKESILNAVKYEEDKIYVMKLPSSYSKLFRTCNGGHITSNKECTRDKYCNYTDFVGCTINQTLDYKVFDIKLNYSGVAFEESFDIYIKFTV